LADGVLGPGAREDWRHLSAVDGRFECRVVGNRTLVIDFAHTPDALETILTAIRRAFPEARVATLFGCGGDRDRGKRPLMGAAVARHSDHTIVTSDNPRFEDPERIIADILEGMPEEGREVVVERRARSPGCFDFLAEPPPGRALGGAHRRQGSRALSSTARPQDLLQRPGRGRAQPDAPRLGV
jgi:UDP-N-acetylmuramoyl-L-alanyl-D-glutamate--2,6-diaminopimelate ligase